MSFKLADMATELKAADLMIMEAGWKYDQGTVTDQDMAMAKLKATEVLAFIADEAIQIHGGMGLMDDLPLERIWRDARVERIWEGTSRNPAPHHFPRAAAGGGRVTMHRLERLLRPKSIAIVGGGAFGTNVVKQSLKMGFAGAVWPVHPTKAEVEGVPAYKSIAELPGAPDATFIGVNRNLTIEIIAQLRERGAGGAICFAAGFTETGDYDPDGVRLQRELIEAAGDMAVIGPNCYGLINYADGALLWPDQHGGTRLAPGTRGVGIITQSSNIACNITMQMRGLPVAFLMTAGNQAQTGLSEMALGLIEDDRVTSLGLHIEGFDSVAGFEKLAARARELKKPVVAMKVGRSEQARAATISHTASLAGSDAASDAFLKRLGIARVHTIPSFLETLKLLHVMGPLPGAKLSSMSCSGGEASVMADSAEGRRVQFPEADGRASTPCEIDARAAGRDRQPARLPHLHLEQRTGHADCLHGDGFGRLRPQHAGARLSALRPLLGRRLVDGGQRLRGGACRQFRARRHCCVDGREPCRKLCRRSGGEGHRPASWHRRSDRRGGGCGLHRRGLAKPARRAGCDGRGGSAGRDADNARRGGRQGAGCSPPGFPCRRASAPAMRSKR